MIPIKNVLSNFVKNCETQKYQKLVQNYVTNIIEKQISESIRKRLEIKDKSLRSDNISKIQQ